MYSTEVYIQCRSSGGKGSQSHAQSRGTGKPRKHRGNTGSTFLLSPCVMCITVGSRVWECVSAGSMGACAADFISTCRKQRQQVHCLSIQTVLSSKEGPQSKIKKAVSYLFRYTVIWLEKVLDLTARSNINHITYHITAFHHRSQLIALLIYWHFGTEGLHTNRVCRVSPVTHLAVTSHPVPGHPIVSPLQGRKQTICPLTWIPLLANTVSRRCGFTDWYYYNTAYLSVYYYFNNFCTLPQRVRNVPS